MRTRSIGTALLSALLIAGIAVTPAAAATVTDVAPTSWAYIDSAAPKASFVDHPGNAPVGARTYANGSTHISKSYVTFDLSTLRGSDFTFAVLSTAETGVTDCAQPRATEVWLTEPVRKPTWNNQPAELVKMGGPYIDDRCPSPSLTWTVTEGVRNAVAAGRPNVSFAFRLPEAQQADVRFGREYSPKMKLTLSHNKLPGKATDFTINREPCAAKPTMVSRSVNLGATVKDGDHSNIGAEYALWPVDRPDQRVTFPETGRSVGDKVWADVGRLLTGDVTYAWQVRGKDDSGGLGPWSAVCKFTTDFTSPTKAPTVTSSDYFDSEEGTGGTGVPGIFIFDAGGDTDVVGFFYTDILGRPMNAAADRPGGKAVVRYTPDYSGANTLSVRGVDAAGNGSPFTDYRFWVFRNQPEVSCTPDTAYVYAPRQCTFKPRGDTLVAGYAYRLNQETESTVSAGPDGSATVTVYPDNPDHQFWIHVRAKLSTGYLTSSSEAGLDIDPGRPIIERRTERPIFGQPVDFTLRAVLPGSETFTYSWADGEWTTVPVGPDGTAALRLNAPASGWNMLYVRSVTAQGQQSGLQYMNVDVASNKPRIFSAEYPEYVSSGGVGIPGTFTFTSLFPGVTAYTYSFDSAPPVTVPADVDGKASITFTPTKPDWTHLTVTSPLPGGGTSETATYAISVRYLAPQATCDDQGYVKPGQVVRCTLNPVQANVATFGWALENGPENTVPPGPDGTAAIEFTVPADQPSNAYLVLRLWSVNTAGLRTEVAERNFYVPSAT
ncbi:DNRLRE domain-containing protein [Kibdelosporangium philippinense]|uniref:DNRLRE domain-containing protein n=1 Tax=Kibdelosporangium philippinense TaxID=211113 RepID=A0ABS8Z8T1_9PSEU|nr:DNRLRE domain-containing protein [Kibdelosporangium philippinense]MCE7004294.1 DNRLRE domain-containing protein [Kibdelosporangium philippinense]